MRLTNPVDQGYVKKLLPDSLGTLIDKMPSLRQGEALLVGESIILPSIVQIDALQRLHQMIFLIGNSGRKSGKTWISRLLKKNGINSPLNDGSITGGLRLDMFNILN